jgi:predicted metal-binding protein
MSYELIRPSVNLGVRGLCVKPYPNHKKGCPNYNKKATCPPQSQTIWDIFHIGEEIYAIWTIFDFAGHVKKMRTKHPSWSQRQLECCLYWQGTARKRLRKEIELFQLSRNDKKWTILQCPEACGVDVTATMKSIGQYLEWPPRTKTYQVAIAGIKWEDF